jgi:tetratricopeptide (TPR) repeat protein
MFRVKNAVLVFLSFILASGPLHAKDEDEWFEYSSQNFILVSNAKPELARETIIKLEKYRFTLGQIIGLNLEQDSSVPLKLYAFATTREFQKVMDAENMLGFYTDMLTGPVSALSLEPREDFWEHDGLETIFHEYNHYILRRYSGMDYPKWYSEGFAEYTSTMEFDGDVALVGKPVASRFMTLRRSGDWFELKGLMKTKSELNDNWKRPHWSIQVYAQGWLLTHFLHHSEKYKGHLQAYLVALNKNGVTEKEAFEQVFGDRRYEFDLEVRQYWLGRELPYSAYDLSGVMPEFAVSERRLPEAEAALVPLEARILTGQINLKRREKTVASDLMAAIDAGIRPGDFYYYLARQAYTNEDWASALAHIEKSLEAMPQSARSIAFKADTIWMASKEDDSFAGRIAELRKLYASAIRLDKRYVPALMEYARLALSEGQDVTSGILKVAKAARMLAPQNDQPHRLEVRLLEKAGQYAEAKARLQHLIEWSYDADDYRDYQKQYDALVEQEAATTAAR